MSQVSLKSFLGSERQGASTGYATAVDFRSLQFHNKIASFAVAAHTLEPLLVEYLAEGAQRDGTVEVAVADELGLDLGGGEEMDGARLLAPSAPLQAWRAFSSALDSSTHRSLSEMGRMCGSTACRENFTP